MLLTTLTTGTLATIAAVHFGLPTLARCRGVRRLRAQCAKRGALVLTYDDGPGTVLTTKLTDLLRSRRVKATFFLTGAGARRDPRLVDRLVLDGHEVGCHTESHRHAWKCWPWTSVCDIAAGYRSLTPWVASDAPFRPPYGKLTAAGTIALTLRRAPIGWWTVDAGDTRRHPPGQAEVLDVLRARGGGVVLMHDFHRDPRRAVHVLTLTGNLLDLADREGWTVTTLGGLASLPSRPRLAPGRVIPWLRRGRRAA